MSSIVPIADLGANRWPRAGKIRLGDRGGKNRAPRKLSHFRFTSADEQAIREIADLYGGTAQPWSDPKANPPDQWEVLTAAKEIRVFLPPGGLSCWYEFWSGGGCVRRCDGLVCEVAQGQGDQAEMVSVPCVCKAENTRTCKPYSRLNVVLPEIRFAGTWELTSTGWNAANELPAMERLIAGLQDHGIIEAVLALEQAQAQGGRYKFVVPRLRLATSALALVAGEASVGALHSGQDGMKALAPVATAPNAADGNVDGLGAIRDPTQEWFDADSEVVDAELVEERPDGDLPPSSGPVEVVTAGADPPLSVAAPPLRPRTGKLTAAETKFLLECTAAAEFVPGTDADWMRHALARKVSKGRTASSRALSSDELAEGIDYAQMLTAETHRGNKTRDDPPTIQISQVIR